MSAFVPFGQKRSTSSGDDRACDVVAVSRAMRQVMALVERAAAHDTSVLVVGESGTGKELLARTLHRGSPRAKGPFVPVNCSAIPDPLLESELFGYKRGSFTGAYEDQAGLLPSAHRGTLFLDEIGDMPPALQAKLLRVLQEKEVRPLGAHGQVPIDFRVVAATNRNLDGLIEEGRFRADLAYRINVITIAIPPLRDRIEDLRPLIEHFVDKHCARLGKTVREITASAMAALRRHCWPGNARELENVIERALVLGTGDIIDAADLPETLGTSASPSVVPTNRRLADVERDHIRRTLRSVAGNKAAAARALGLNRKTLYRKIRQHRIS